MLRFRVLVSRFFPYESIDPEKPGPVHAVVFEREGKIYCSQEMFAKLRALPDGDGSEHKNMIERLGLWI